MKPQKFIASTTRAALARVRETLGEDAVILSNRSTPQGVEVVAIAEGDFESMVGDTGATRAPAGRDQTIDKRPSIADQIASQLQGLRPPVAAAEPVAAMAAQGGFGAREAPTAPAPEAPPRASFPWEERQAARQQFSFIDFVRGRRPSAGTAPRPVDHVLRTDVHLAKVPVPGAAQTPTDRLFERVPETMDRPTAGSMSRPGSGSGAVPDRSAAPTLQRAVPQPSEQTRAQASTASSGESRRNAPSASTALPSDEGRDGAEDRRGREVTGRSTDDAVFDEREILDELRTLRALVQGNLTGAPRSAAPPSAVGPEVVARRRDEVVSSVKSPASGVSASLRRDLLSSGFASDLVDEALQGMPANLAIEEAREWMVSRLASLLVCGTALDDVVEAGGVYAVTGPTGVGKTTTAAKLAARCAVRYGAASVGLITTDTYRIGAPDQLRIYGKILGVPVHTVHDHEWLQRVLEGMSERRLVLVDTIGMGQRDARIGRTLDLLDAFRIKRLLLVAAASQPEMHDEVLEFYRGATAAGVVLAKIDEAVKVAPALSTLMARRLVLRYLTNGQRVPEDLHIPDPTNLVRTALRADGRGMPARSVDPRPAPASQAR